MACAAFFAAIQAAAAPSELHALAAEKNAANADAAGWLQVPGTDIDEVVMHKNGGDNSYYLRRDAYGNYSFEGSYFADFRCDFTSGALSRNTVIYGHSFSDNPDDRRFSQLLRYRDADFAAGHPYFYFADTERTMTWQVFAVSIMDIHTPYNAPNPDDDEFVRTLGLLRESSMWDYSDVQVGADDRILTLSTQDFSNGRPYPNDYRFVIAAKLLKEGAQSGGVSLSANLSPSTGR